MSSKLARFTSRVVSLAQKAVVGTPNPAFQPGDTVLDIFAGSNTTGQMAQQSGRKWLAFEYEGSYLDGSRFRFQDPEDIAASAEFGMEGPSQSGAVTERN